MAREYTDRREAQVVGEYEGSQISEAAGRLSVAEWYYLVVFDSGFDEPLCLHIPSRHASVKAAPY